MAVGLLAVLGEALELANSNLQQHISQENHEVRTVNLFGEPGAEGATPSAVGRSGAVYFALPQISTIEGRCKESFAIL